MASPLRYKGGARRRSSTRAGTVLPFSEDGASDCCVPAARSRNPGRIGRSTSLPSSCFSALTWGCTQTNEGGKTEEATTCELNNLTPASLTSIDEYFRAGKFAPRCPTVVQPNSNVTFGVQKTTWMFGLLTEYSGGLAFEMRFPNNQTDWIGIVSLL